MIEPEIPKNEAKRLDALHAYQILDTLPEKAFDDLTFIASQICEVPIALISLIDSDRQWFKSKLGLTVSETDRSFSFCAHAILNPDKILEVNDTLKDERFSENPFVQDDPFIRFYAGMPLITEAGEALGTLCVIDQKPRELTNAQRRALEALSRQVMAQLELRNRLNVSKERTLHFESILEAAGDAVFELSSRGRFSYVNEYMVSMCGQSRSDLLNMHFLDLIHSADRKRVNDYYVDMIKNAEVNSSIQFRIKHPSGNEVTVSQNVQLVYEKGLFSKAIGIVRDISNKKELEQQLKLTQLSVNLSPVGFAVVQKDARVVSFNTRYAELLGVSFEDMETQFVYEFDTHFDEASWDEHWEEMLKINDMQMETQFQHVDGSFRSVELRLKMLDFEDKNFIHAVALDITARKEQEAVLNHYKDLLEKTNEIARIGTWEVDLQRNIPHWSKITREIHEMPEDFEPDLSTAIDFYKPGENRTRITGVFGDAVAKGVSFDEVLEIITGKGNNKWVRTIGIPVVNKGACERIYGMFQDITVQKMNENILTERKQQLEFANEELQRFAYMVTHDLKLPLSNIRGHMDIIKMEAPPEADMLLQSIGWVAESLNQADEKIAAVLEVASYENDLPAASELYLTSISEAALKAAESIESKLNAAEGTIEIDIPAHIKVLANKNSLESIFENLFSNAVKYSRSGVSPKIIVKATSEEAQAIITVQDNGLGMNLKKDGKKLFSMFGRIHSDLNVSGTGIGLYLTRKGIMNLGGDLSVISSLGKGSTFTIQLPL